MKSCRTTALSISILLGGSATVFAQPQNAPYSQKFVDSTTHATKNTDSQLANQCFRRILDTVNNSWFGSTYANMNAVDIQGNLVIHLTASDINAKIKQLNHSDIKNSPITEGSTVNLKVTGTYFANADFRMELTGGFGNLIYYRVGNKGFLYSREQNAWTSRIDLPPVNAPGDFLGWFRQCINDIESTYLDQNVFKISTEKGTSGTQTIVFTSTTGPYNPNKTEQTIAESLGFWKRGRVEMVADKNNYQPQQMHYSNDSQGIDTYTTFRYNAIGKPSSITINNKSRGMGAPMSFNVNYNSNGLIDHMSGKTSFGKGTMNFDMSLNFVKNRSVSSIITVPPPTATKKGREELEMLLLTSISGKMHELQKVGLGIRGPKIANGQ